MAITTVPGCDCIRAYSEADKLAFMYCLLLSSNGFLETIAGGGSSGALASQVQGTAADDSPAVGNPVQVGGVAVSGAYAPAYADGDAAKLAIDGATGALLVLSQPLTSADVVTVASSGFSAQTTITRPANTTPYTAGDVLGGALTIPNIGPLAGSVILTNLALMPQIAAIPAGMTSFRLHLYSITPPSALADNAAWDLPAGDRASYLGYVDLGSPADFGSTLFVQAVQVNQQVKLTTTSLFAYLVTNGGFTPAANSEVYRLDTNAVGT
jgi:hypothetical protein